MSSSMYVCKISVSTALKLEDQAHLPARQAFLGTIISAQGSFCSDFSGFITIDDKGIGKGST
jgi:hypothetical protein